jgi:cholest-4-en-3-one 26-monooxygenase
VSSTQQTHESAPEPDFDKLRVADPEHWTDGPPHELFAQLRNKCPVHWSDGMSDYPDETGYWSVTRAEDIRAVSLDWQTYSSHVGGVLISTYDFPLELAQQEFIAMDPPRHDRIKALFQAGFTPRRIAEQEPLVRGIVTDVLNALEGRETCDLVSDFAQPVVSRVIGKFVGIPIEEDHEWAEMINAALGYDDPEMRGEWTAEELMNELFRRVSGLIEARQEQPHDDLLSILVHAEVEGERLAHEEIVMGFQLLMEAGNDSTKATFCSGMRALIEHPDQRQLVLDDPSLIPSAIEESLRMFPAFAHFRRTATRDAELAGQQIKQGDKVIMWYPSSNRQESVYDEPNRFEIHRNAAHQAFGAGGRHFCLGAALARLELRIMFEEILNRYPHMELAGRPVMAESTFINQLKALPVKLGERAA